MNHLTNLLQKPKQFAKYLDYLGGRGLIWTEKTLKSIKDGTFKAFLFGIDHTRHQKYLKKHLFINRFLLFFCFLFILITSFTYSLEQGHSYDKLQERSLKLQKLNTQLQELQKTNTTTTQELKAKDAQQQNLQNQINDLNNQLQAKKARQAEEARLAAIQPAPQQIAYFKPINFFSGDPYMDFIIAHESGGNAYAINPSSGACGIAQELPCGKSGCALGDGQCQMNWMRQYCISRYGSTYNAYLYWLAHSNY